MLMAGSAAAGAQPPPAGLDAVLTVTVTPEGAPAGEMVEIKIEGLSACFHSSSDDSDATWHNLTVAWDGVPLHEETLPSDPLITLPYSVPADATARDYEVTATCGGLVANDVFTAVAPPPDPNLVLDTSEPQRGSTIRATGSDFVCSSSVDLNWADDETPITQAPPRDFDVPIRIDDDAPLGPRLLVAQCQDDPTITDSQSVDIVAAPATPTTTTATPTMTTTTAIPTTTTPPTTAPSTTDRVEEGGTTAAEEPRPSGSIWPWLVALVLVAAALLAARHLRHRHQERQFSRVRVATSTTTPPAAAFHETPAYGEMTYAIRVEARAATSIPTITEVHHDS